MNLYFFILNNVCNFSRSFSSQKEQNVVTYCDTFFLAIFIAPISFKMSASMSYACDAGMKVTISALVRKLMSTLATRTCSATFHNTYLIYYQIRSSN